MIKNVLTEIGGIATFGVISICLFFLVFSGALLWTLLLKKPFLKTMSQLPLSDEPLTSPQEGDQAHE